MILQICMHENGLWVRRYQQHMQLQQLPLLLVIVHAVHQQPKQHCKYCNGQNSYTNYTDNAVRHNFGKNTGTSIYVELCKQRWPVLSIALTFETLYTKFTWYIDTLLLFQYTLQPCSHALGTRWHTVCFISRGINYALVVRWAVGCSTRISWCCI